MNGSVEASNDKIHATVLAGTIMTEMAGKMSESFDTFATWVLAGFGAGITLLLEKESDYSVVPVSTIKFSVVIFLLCVLVVVFEKYLAILIGASANSQQSRGKKLLRISKDRKRNKFLFRLMHTHLTKRFWQGFQHFIGGRPSG